MAQGLLVYAQKTIQIGTIGISQVAQPALAQCDRLTCLGRADEAHGAVPAAGQHVGRLAHVGRQVRPPRAAAAARPAAAVITS